MDTLTTAFNFMTEGWGLVALMFVANIFFTVAAPNKHLPSVTSDDSLEEQ